MKHENYDFSGWATRNDLKCSDGRTIRHNAFKDCDGTIVPLVWNHGHNDPEDVLGHAMLENRDEGVYCYGTFNDTPAGVVTKSLVQHGDITKLSIYANQLKQAAGDVIHGVIREVSLVHAGANPGAYIDTVLAHSDNDEAEVEVLRIITDLSLEHSDSTDKNENDNNNPAEQDKKGATMAKEKTIQEIFDELTEEQKQAVYVIIGQAIEDAKEESSNKKDEEDENMKHNVFETDTVENTLSHDAMKAILADGKRYGTLKESFLAHAEEYGIENIEWLFPDAKNLSDKPGFITRQPDSWVSVVMNGVHHTPFSRIKMIFADLREDDARAKGYATKAELKTEQVFGLLKRQITPTTVYIKQKIDRDDALDITDFDVIAWLKAEMRMMLDEEIARAILFGDGRLTASPDKISATNIIPAYDDAALYTIQATVTTDDAADLIDAAVIAQDTYEGSGNTTMFVPNSIVTKMLLLKDRNLRRIYKDVAEIALACAVNKIVKVPDTIVPAGVKALILDLNDYNVGADKGGSVNLFDDFDIDYNQQKYLMETRCSGALTKPFSAIVIKKVAASGDPETT